MEPRPPAPIIERNPVLFWQLLSALLALVIVLLIVIILRK
jgi:hypothetical protein